jgi:hypothetical protein
VVAAVAVAASEAVVLPAAALPVVVRLVVALRLAVRTARIPTAQSRALRHRRQVLPPLPRARLQERLLRRLADPAVAGPPVLVRVPGAAALVAPALVHAPTRRSNSSSSWLPKART